MSNILSDIAALAKAGYNPAEVKEILTLANGAPDAPADKPAETDSKENSQPEPEKASEAPKDQEAKKEEPVKDAKQQEIDDLKEKIRKLEEANASKNNAGSIDKDKKDPLIDLVRSYM